MAFEKLSSDKNFNFQINRLMSYGDEACRKEELIKLASKVTTFEEWYIEWKNIACTAEQEKRYLHSSYYYRMAEFFLLDSDPEKDKMYKKMKEMFYLANPNLNRHKIKFKNSHIPAIVIKSPKAKGIVLIHGGYDSFIEEFYLMCKSFTKNGYSVIMFEGEGQGATLREGLNFNYKWETSVKAVLDYFNISTCSLIGISWGGYFALRAAAKDKRIKNVVAYDIMYDGLDVQFSLLGKKGKIVMNALYKLKLKKIINLIVRRAQSKSHLTRWAIEHGIYITGTNSPYEFYKSIEKHNLKTILPEINQNVLLMAGEADHYIPISHFYLLKNNLTKAKVTSRLFLEKENAGQHCQVGNYEIALSTIIQWLDTLHE